MSASLLAEVRSVGKSFGPVRAVIEASASFRGGEIHAVCGENGAGKSTLLKLVAGMMAPDTGEVLVGGTPLEPPTPKGAIDRGVAMVLQHFALVPVFTALENIMLGAEPVRGGVLDVDVARTKVSAIMKELGAEVALDTPVEQLGVGDRQRIEIARALYREAKLLILDEPTAVLTKNEVTALYRTLRRLAERGTGIVVVTHKMDEVRAHADVITVMRKGEVIFTRPIVRGGDVGETIDDITRAIMGGAGVKARPDEAGARELGAPVCTLEDVSVVPGLRGATLELRGGEIVGVAGVEGNGQRELVDVLAGDVSPHAGRVLGGPFAIVHEDRQSAGLVLDAPLRDNIMLGELERFTSWGIVRVGALEREARERLERSGAPNDLDRTARTLSGGNQQKVVVTRALARKARAVIVSQPTRGVDLAAAGEIHARFREAAREGAGVLVISADLDELRALSDRILVLVRGRFAAEVPPTTSDDELGRLMLGGGGSGGGG